MTAAQIEALKKLDRAPDGSCWCCATVMRGHFEGCPVGMLPRLLAERERLLVALRVAEHEDYCNEQMFSLGPPMRQRPCICGMDAALAFAEESA